MYVNMYVINYGYGYERKEYKSLAGATRAAKSWCQKCQASATMLELQGNSKAPIAVRRVWAYHYEDIK